jgi:hypothetical protein
MLGNAVVAAVEQESPPVGLDTQHHAALAGDPNHLAADKGRAGDVLEGAVGRGRRPRPAGSLPSSARSRHQAGGHVEDR